MSAPSLIGLPKVALAKTGGCMAEADREGHRTIPQSVRGGLASYMPLAPGQVFPPVPDEIVHFIHDKGTIAKWSKASDPVSYLLAAVPEGFAGASSERSGSALNSQCFDAGAKAVVA
jgi:hypothetical protein